jgi:hypothetical protein
MHTLLEAHFLLNPTMLFYRCHMTLTVCLKLIRFFTLIFDVFLEAGGLQTLIFTMRSQLGGAADRADIIKHTYLWPFTSSQAFLHTMPRSRQRNQLYNILCRSVQPFYRAAMSYSRRDCTDYSLLRGKICVHAVRVAC